MDELLNWIVALAGKCSPTYGLIAVALLALFGGRIKDWLGGLKLPNLRPAPKPDEPKPAPSPDVDLDEWLEQHPLLDRLWQKLKLRFADAATDEDQDEDDLYVSLTRAIKSAGRDE